MKSAGVTFKKLKEVKYRRLITLYKKYLSKSPQNCKFNYKYMFVDGDGKEKEIRLCLYNQKDVGPKGIDPHMVDLCEEKKHYQKCNAFIYKHSKDDVKKIFDKQLKDKNFKANNYPDICALEWVLEREDFIKNPGIFSKIIYLIKKFIFKEVSKVD